VKTKDSEINCGGGRETKAKTVLNFQKKVQTMAAPGEGRGLKKNYEVDFWFDFRGGK